MTTLETLLNNPDTAGVWNLVPDRSTISFKIKNMWGLLSVKGQFADFTGDGQLTGKGAVFGRVDINVASLHTGIGRRDQHLLSADFFDAERFPQISVVVTALQPTAGKDAELRASFTIKGNTETVPLAQLFELVVPTPRNPNSIAMFECAEPPKTWSARVWFTPRVPFFKNRMC